MSPLIDLQAVSKSYGTNWAVRELSLQIPPGELFACLGPNGAGKTTTIKMITGLLRPTEGRVFVAGKDMATNSLEARRCLSYVPDEPHLYEKLSGREFLTFTREIYGLSGPEVQAYTEELIDTFETRDYIDELTETYSHGMRQRLVFASALLHRPRVLVVDEPMVGLDPKSVRIVKDLLKKAAREGTAIFMSTHTLAIAEEMAHRIGIFHQGRLIRCGTIDELRRETTSDTTLEDFFLQVTADAEQAEVVR
jgi:ABC-2 type transport system ATP-binding protein